MTRKYDTEQTNGPYSVYLFEKRRRKAQEKRTTEIPAERVVVNGMYSNNGIAHYLTNTMVPGSYEYRCYCGHTSGKVHELYADEITCEKCRTIYEVKKELGECMLTTNEFVEEFFMERAESIIRYRTEGMPYLIIRGVMFYPRNACHRWFSGVDDECMSKKSEKETRKTHKQSPANSR